MYGTEVLAHFQQDIFSHRKTS